MEVIGPESVATRFEAAWNAHDMTAFAGLFHPEATFVNRFGAYSRGVEAIVEGHRFIHEGICRDSTIRIEPPDVDRISEDIAVLHLWSRL